MNFLEVKGMTANLNVAASTAARKPMHCLFFTFQFSRKKAKSVGR